MAFDQDALATADRLTQGVKVYVDGRLTLSEWTGSDGTKKHGINVMSWHCRIPHIGRNKPKREKQAGQHEPPAERPAVHHTTNASDRPFYNDDLPF